MPTLAPQLRHTVKGLGFRGLGFRGLGFRGLGFRGTTVGRLLINCSETFPHPNP